MAPRDGDFVACKCTDPICGHPDGLPCGAPVQNPLPIANVDGHGIEGPEFLTGLCEECWNRVEPEQR